MELAAATNSAFKHNEERVSRLTQGPFYQGQRKLTLSSKFEGIVQLLHARRGGGDGGDGEES